MARTTVHERLRRIELLAVQLKQDTHCTVQDLALQHGVSTRTITRDLSLMRDQGMQIDADRGRGGGVRLDRNWGGMSRTMLKSVSGDAADLMVTQPEPTGQPAH